MSSFISLEEALEMTADYNSNRESILKPEYQGKNILCIHESFEKEKVDVLFSKPGVVGLRIWYGMDAEQKVHAILVGTNTQGQDVIYLNSLHSSASSTVATQVMTEENNPILENGQRCPEECGPY